jgi:hypothetical protein
MLEPPARFPVHVEAYPAIAAQTAMTRWRRGRPKFLWRTEEGEYVGHGRVTSLSRWEMEVMFVVEPRPHLPRCRDGKLLEIDYAVRSS